MPIIVITSYTVAALAFLAGSVLLAVGWRRQRIGTLLLVATAVSALWAAFLAWGQWRHGVPASWVLGVEALRDGAWLAFVGALFSAWPVSGLLRAMRVGAHALWIAVALYGIALALGLPWQAAPPRDFDVPFIALLVLALLGLMFLEQVYRNIGSEQRWALKFLVIALGVVFAYDIFLYSYAVLYRQINPSAWAARGFVNALVVPLLVVAAARNPRWSLQVGVSRRVVFYSSSLLVVACYLIATALGGYYVRLYGGTWGRVAAITLVCLALLGLLVVASSGQARSRLRVFLHKNFFSLRYDYREEWMRLTNALAAGETELPQRIVRALAAMLDSPAGALCVRNDDDHFVPDASWNLALSADLALPANLPAFELMRTRRWIYDLGEAAPLGDARLAAPPGLAALPNAWLLVPLVVGERLVGFVVLAQARARRELDWEDIDLLRAAGSQAAGTLAQAADARRLAEARQFEGFNRLTAFLMHDLKNVAAQQSLLLQNAARHKHNPAFIDDMLATVDNSVRRIQRLLEQLRGEVPSAASGRVQVSAVIARALAECHAHPPQPECEPVPDGLWVQADAEQLAIVIGHVLRNAQDAAGAHGHVRLTARAAAGDVAIDIEDDGAGMDESFVRERLFKPFFTTKASKGMGMGAYQAREYVRALGGRVEVASTPGHGTRFGIRLPLVEPAPAASTVVAP